MVSSSSHLWRQVLIVRTLLHSLFFSHSDSNWTSSLDLAFEQKGAACNIDLFLFFSAVNVLAILYVPIVATDEFLFIPFVTRQIKIHHLFIYSFPTSFIVYYSHKHQSISPFSFFFWRTAWHQPHARWMSSFHLHSYVPLLSAWSTTPPSCAIHVCFLARPTHARGIHTYPICTSLLVSPSTPAAHRGSYNFISFIILFSCFDFMTPAPHDVLLNRMLLHFHLFRDF